MCLSNLHQEATDMSAGRRKITASMPRWPRSKNAWDTAMILEHDLMRVDPDGSIFRMPACKRNEMPSDRDQDIGPADADGMDQIFYRGLHGGGQQTGHHSEAWERIRSGIRSGLSQWLSGVVACRDALCDRRSPCLRKYRGRALLAIDILFSVLVLTDRPLYRRYYSDLYIPRYAIFPRPA